MKQFSFVMAALLMLAASCAPQTYTVQLERRGASSSGIVPLNRNISVIYVSGPQAGFSNAVASGFATALEKHLFEGREAVGLYSIPAGGEQYSSQDSLVKYVVETGDDLIFLFDQPEITALTLDSDKALVDAAVSADSAYFAEGTLKFHLKMYSYDALAGEKEALRNFSGSDQVKLRAFHEAGLGEAECLQRLMEGADAVAFQVGSSAARPFIPQWNQAQYPIYYFDSYAWENAALSADDMEWRSAAEQWLRLFEKSKNPIKRSVAAFNMATALHILGDNSLALAWLDRSDREEILEESAALRKKIQAEL